MKKKVGNPLKTGITLKNKIQGIFEETLSKGTVSIIMWLAVAMISIVLVCSFILVIMHLKPNNAAGEHTFIEAVWQSFLRVIDPGAIQNDELWSYRVVSGIITLIGVFIFGALVGVLTTGLDNMFIEIRKGKTEIIKKDFTLILGWNPTIFKIISELVISNANHKNKSIVILSKYDKIKMEDEINQKINQKELLKNYHTPLGNKKRKTYQTKIYCRSGNIIDLNDLKIVHPENAESVIILSAEDENSDIDVIKCILALKSKVKKIITEIKNEKNKELMDFCFEKEDENRNIYYIPSRKWLSRITAQTSRQSGFSVIATEILNYENDEIYFAKVDEITPSIIGKTFKDVLLNCTTSIVLGIRKNNWNEEKLKENLREDYKQELKSKNKDKLLGLKKNIILNPFEKLKNNILDNENIGCLIEKGDELILLQSDDGKPEFNFEKMKSEEVQWSKEKAKSLSKCSILILGYNERVPKVINELYEYIDKNSEIHIIANIKNEVQEKLEEEFKERNITIEIKDTTDYKVFENRKEFLNSFDSIIIMGYDDIDIQEKDAKSMLTMLLLKKMLENGEKGNTKEKKYCY